MKELTENQKLAISAPVNKHCVVVAVAGAGKTTVLEQRVKLLISKGAQKMLIITFTKKAAQNLKKRLGETPPSVFIGTIHSFCYQVLKEFCPDVLRPKFLGEGTEFRIRTYAAQYASKNKLRLEAKDCELEIQRFFQEGLPPESWAKVSSKKNLARMCEYVYTKLSGEGFMFFEELIVRTKQLLENNLEVRETLQKRFPIVKVDEFQDTNGLQCALLQYLIGDTGHLYVVGDSSQSIYTWRGCDPTMLENFESVFGETNRIILDTNFRSNDNILSTANEVLTDLKADTEMKGVKGEGVPIRIKKFKDEGEEAESIIDEIAEAGSYTDYAILYRVNQQSGLFQSGLAKKKIPFSVSGTSQSFFDMPEIKPLVAYLRLAVDIKDIDSLRVVWNKPTRYLKSDWLSAGAASKETMNAPEIVQAVSAKQKMGPAQRKNLRALGSLLSEIKGGTSPEQVLEHVMARVKYQGHLEALAALSETRQLVDIERAVDQFVSIAKSFTSIKALLDHVEYTKQLQKENEKRGNGVTLSTIHSAKGLEFPKVYVIGVNSDILPHEKMFDLEEERRLFYVAVTRAEDDLTISWYGKPSKFLNGLRKKNDSKESLQAS